MKYRSYEPFNEICPHTTRVACTESLRKELGLNHPNPPFCDRVHFRPLIRAHTDDKLGHCSYLNTCYSEPTYAHSTAVTPFASSRPGGGAVNVPSGLGAGGRGKEKAPCRYLHFEVDLDPGEIHPEEDIRRRPPVKRPYRLDIGAGPYGKDTPQVRDLLTIKS